MGISPSLRIRGREAIGDGLLPYVIAEIGTNHNRNLETARTLVQKIAESGCDCAKFQIYEPDEIVSARVRAKDYGLDAQYGDISAQEMFARNLQTPKEWFPELLNLSRDLGMACAATVHGQHGRNWAKTIGFDLIKVASMDHTNTPFLESLVDDVAAPILISFGMAHLADIDAAVEVLRPHRGGIGMFHCVAIYPPTAEEIRLPNISFLRRRYGLAVGFSDHTEDTETALTAAVLGARVFEKHVTLDRRQPGPDHPFALEPDMLATYVAGLKKTLSKAIEVEEDELEITGDSFAPPPPREIANRACYLKSLITRHDLPVGHRLRREDVYFARPGTGMAPSDLNRAIGRHLEHAVSAEMPLTIDDLN